MNVKSGLAYIKQFLNLIQLAGIPAFFRQRQDEIVTFNCSVNLCFKIIINALHNQLLAGITGFINLIMIKDRTAMAAALIHGGINLTAILVFSVFAYKSWNLYPQVQVPILTVLTVKLLTVVFIFVGNYLGGRLIFKHHIAIEP